MPEWLIKLITEWIRDKKTGSLTINFFKGGIRNVNKKVLRVKGFFN